MFGIRPAFDNELEPVSVDTKVLELSFRDALEDIFEVGSRSSKFQSLHVDVTSRLMPLSNSSEWQIKMPPGEAKLYVAVSALIREIGCICNGFVRLGKMMPQEFTVSVFTLKNSDPHIVGSADK
jgi:hypothetical protein